MSQFPLPNSAQRQSTGVARKKTPVAVGRSLMDWIRLSKSGKDLRGTGPRLIPVTGEELAKHNKITDAWMAIRGWVYNVTSYMEYHPGGASELMRGAGMDATELFDSVHRWVNIESMLQACVVGKLVDTPMKAPVVVGKQPSSSKHLAAPMQLTTSLLVPNRPKKKPVNDGGGGGLGLKVPNIAMLVPPTSQPTSTVINVPTITPPVTWKQSPQSVVVTYTHPVVDHFTCDVIDDGARLLIEVFDQTKSCGCDVRLSSKVSCQIGKVSNDDGKIEVELMKLGQDGDWPTLGEICPLQEDARSHRRTCTVEDRQELTHDTHLYRIGLPPNSRIATPVGAHIYLQIEVEGMEISRPYTVALPTMEDHVDQPTDVLHLIIKSYDDGVLTSRLRQHYDKGASVVVFARGEGRYDMGRLEGVGRVLMIAAGTGFTPMIRVIHHCLNRASVTPNLHLLFFNKRHRDVIWRDELTELERSCGAKFKAEHVLSAMYDEEWSGRHGRVSLDMLREMLGHNSDVTIKVFVCGPAPFTQLVRKFLRELKIDESHVHAFT